VAARLDRARVAADREDRAAPLCRRRALPPLRYGKAALIRV